VEKVTEYKKRTKTHRVSGATSDEEGLRERAGSAAGEKGSSHRNSSCEVSYMDIPSDS